MRTGAETYSCIIIFRVKIILLGPPGAGKGTQAARLEREFGFRWVSVGDMLRKHAAEGVELGRKIKSFLDKGELVPDEIIMELIEKSLSHENIIFDGFPRNLNQAKALDALLAKRNEGIDAVVLISVPEKELIKRLTARRVCSNCGENYNLITKPPKNDNRCDICGGLLYQREDDNEETVKRRLAVYHEATKPLIDFYSKRGNLIVIRGTGSPDEIYVELKKALEL